MRVLRLYMMYMNWLNPTWVCAPNEVQVQRIARPYDLFLRIFDPKTGNSILFPASTSFIYLVHAWKSMELSF